jgi:pimeloyl-ACP methyl ester carboxylesterase
LIIPDLRGFGETDFVGDAEEWSVPTTVEDLIELLDYYHIDKVILVAHDYGAITAWAMQKLHPNRVAAIASIGFADIALEQIGGEPEYPGQPPTERVKRKRARGEDSPVSYVLDFANIARKSEGIVSRNAIIGLYQLENSTMLATAGTPRDDNVLPPDLLLVLDKCSVVNPISRQLTVHKNVDLSFTALEPVLNDPTVYPDLPVLVIGCGKDKAWTPELVESARIHMRYPKVEIRREDTFFHYCLNQQGAKDRLRGILGDWVDSLEV